MSRLAAADWNSLPAEICQEIFGTDSHVYSRSGQVCKAWNKAQKQSTCRVRAISLGHPVDTPMLPSLEGGSWPEYAEIYSFGVSLQRRFSQGKQVQGWLQEHASENLHMLKMQFWAESQPFQLLARYTHLTHLHIERIYFTVVTTSCRLAFECVSANLVSLVFCAKLPWHTFSLRDLNRFQQLQHLRMRLDVVKRCAGMYGDLTLPKLQELVIDGSHRAELVHLTLQGIPIDCQMHIEGVILIQEAAKARLGIVAS